MSNATAPAGGALSRWAPRLITGLVLVWVLTAAAPAPVSDEFDIEEFASLPVVDLGRPKPLDTLARTSLVVISNKQSVYIDGDRVTADRDEKGEGRKAEAIEWLAGLMSDPESARADRVIRIDHPDIKGILGADIDRKYFSVGEIVEVGADLNRQFELANAVPSDERNLYQQRIMQLSQKMSIYFYLEDPSQMFLFPPADDDAEWGTVLEQSQAARLDGTPAEEALRFTQALVAWRDGDAATFNDQVGAQHEAFAAAAPSTMRKVRFEAMFNRAAPFVKAMTLYVIVGLLAFVFWLRPNRAILATALGILLVGVLIHTAGIGSRIWIQGRPPVTNLYSSALFVGWGTVLLGGWLERIHWNGIGAVTAGVTGFLTLLVAHNLAVGGDTMTMMQAVLDTNFWLATHVIVITLGYSGTFLAGFLAIVMVLRGVFTKGLGRQDRRSLTSMIYGVICFSTLFSFVGTILGGIWADQSWGRFWGWDPKENGALMIVLWNALILHARWGGIAGQRGIACLAIGGNVITAWSWFGTNMLGVGLHAYGGFIGSALWWMFAFVASQVLLILFGATPFEKWRSVAAEREAAGVPTGPKAA